MNVLISLSILIYNMDLPRYLAFFLRNFSVGNFHQYTFRRDFGVWIRFDGFVHWAHGGLFSTTCDLNLKDYPFDSHNCSIIIESWLYDGTEISLTVLEPGRDMKVIYKNQFEICIDLNDLYLLILRQET